ncbi:MAG TPA: hypothetical protein PLT92_14810 [Ignavibacteriaceae bacterium]|nr:hypothetical protein [Ignavibacteriaceae bacterium]
MSQIIKLKRGLKANLPSSGMNAGEPLFTTDRGTLHVAIDATTKKPVVPAIDDLSTIPSISAAEDLIIIHDASEASAQKEKKITFADFKSALNIPAGDTDEKVAVVNGGTAGYIYGTNGTDGIFRMGSSMKWTKDAGNAFVTLDVDVVDGGTF